MEWIIGIGVALFVLFLIVGIFAQKKHGQDMVTGGSGYIRAAVAVILSTLLERAQRPELSEDENASRIEIERIFPTAMAAGRKLFGDVVTEEVMQDELKGVVKYGPNYLIAAKEHGMIDMAQQKCSIERKDDIVLAAMTALQLNYSEPAEEFKALRLFTSWFYTNPLDGDRRMLGADSPVNLLESSIVLSNEIVRELTAKVDANAERASET